MIQFDHTSGDLGCLPRTDGMAARKPAGSGRCWCPARWQREPRALPFVMTQPWQPRFTRRVLAGASPLGKAGCGPGELLRVFAANQPSGCEAGHRPDRWPARIWVLPA